MKAKVTILTGLVRSGKTTLLMRWMEQHPRAHGIITPDIEGIRFFLHYPEKKLIKMQETDHAKETIKVGRFLFSKESFDQVNQLLINDINLSTWIIIDEIGPLELKGKGLFPAFEYALKSKHKKILIVVRSNLLERIIEEFGLEGASVIFKENLADVD